MFYDKYLGIDRLPEEEVTVYVSEQRNMPLNKIVIYRLILTDYQGKRIISASDTLKQDLLNRVILCTKGKTIAQTYDAMKDQEWGFRLSYMYRMFQEEDKPVELTNHEKLSITYLSEYKKSFATIDGEPIGYCKISDVYGTYGNIVVWVDERYRKQGIASLLLNDLLGRCKKEQIVPIYLVMKSNEASICLAQKFGFRIQKEEIILCEEKERTQIRL